MGTALADKNFALSWNFALSCEFRNRLQKAIGLEESIPAESFAAMDFHLDWIAAALTAFANRDTKQVFANESIDGEKLVMGNQEDVDFLVCFKGSCDIYNLIFLEAKAYGAWDSKQMKSKMKRLRCIFGDKGKSIDKVKPVLCLTSPRRPRLKYEDWPEWCLSDGESPYWLELPLPDNRLLVTRWDTDACKSSEDGRHFNIQDA